MLHTQIVYQKDIGYFYAFLIITVTSAKTVFLQFVLL